MEEGWRTVKMLGHYRKSSWTLGWATFISSLSITEIESETPFHLRIEVIHGPVFMSTELV